MTATAPYLVIGASTGLGEATVRALRDRGARVVTAGRSAGDVRVDLRSLRDVARAGDELAKLGPFAGIVCNAGMQAVGDSKPTADGLDETFAVNVLAHVALVERLVAPGTRVAMIGSSTFDVADAGARRFGFRGGLYSSATALARGETADPSPAPGQRAKDRYATSKLCNVLYARALARRGVDAFAFDPGLMPGTGLAREYGWFARLAWSTVLKVAALVMRGASSARRSGRALAAYMTADAIEPGAYYEFTRRPMALPAAATRDADGDDLVTTCRALIASAAR